MIAAARQGCFVLTPIAYGKFGALNVILSALFDRIYQQTNPSRCLVTRFLGGWPLVSLSQLELVFKVLGPGDLPLEQAIKLVPTSLLRWCGLGRGPGILEGRVGAGFHEMIVVLLGF